MASNNRESAEDPTFTSDLVTLISKGKVKKAVLKLYAEKGLLDIPDKDGRTPLMIACLKGLKKAVKFLLANGANPNSKCPKEGNTPMHYACTVEGTNCYHPYRRMTSKVDIINLLLKSGAQVDQENLDGWTPPCIAALFRLRYIVDYFLENNDFKLPLEMKIRVIEILGVSLALICDAERLYNLDELFNYFSQAIRFQKDAALPKAQLGTSDLVDCFTKLSLKECHTAEEIESVTRSYLGLKAHAFLVGDRVFSNALKKKHLYPALGPFARDLICDLKFKEAHQLLSCAIGFELRGELRLGSVVENLAQLLHKFIFEIEDKELSHQDLQSVRDVLCEYESVLNLVHIDNLSDNANCILLLFGGILFGEAYYSSVVDVLISTLQTIETSVRVIRGRIRKENPDQYHKLCSVTFKIMSLLAPEFVKCISNTNKHVPTRPLCRVKFVLRKTLFFDTALHIGCRSDDTLLHLVAYGASTPRHLEHLEDLALAFVRHGCPVDAMNSRGDTARKCLTEDAWYDQKRYPRLLTLVSPPTTALTLEELAIRQILQNDISYLGEVPTCLYGMIRGGLKDSDLQRATDEASSDEE